MKQSWILMAIGESKRPKIIAEYPTREEAEAARIAAGNTAIYFIRKKFSS